MKKLIVFLSILALTTIEQSKAQTNSIPFNCDYSAYLFQTNDVYALDLASGSSYLVASNLTSGNINAAGYNPTDGYIWGYLSTPSSSIIRIGKNFNTTTYTIPNLPTGNNYVGDIDSNGIYYCKASGATYHKIDINPNSSNYLTYLGSYSLTTSLSIADWAFNSVDGQLYTAEKNSNKLYRINPTNGQVTDLGVIPAMQGLNYTYGAVYFDSSGRFYISANQTGTIYVVQDVQSLTGSNPVSSNLFCFGPSSSSNDGARCPTAPVPQEDCVNGIDDDNDGLVDCDDPACSGVASCPTIAPPVGGGNQGGLESNRRLSEQINQRNYLRRKNNYHFNSAEAAIFQPSLSKTTGSDFNLSQLIPQQALEGTLAKESSALDLVNITNATEIISVDYIKDDEPIAVILATRTEDAVYEHTKYICDRLLGSELINVSTILINDHKFIRSIIKNNDGSQEFVLSLSASVNADDETEIESHWNIDKYPTGTTYYNFQIWSNQIDDLVQLTTSVLDLIHSQKSIAQYNLSSPPPVYVKRGKYVNGSLDLEIVNTNLSTRLNIQAGLKKTETSQIETISRSFNISDSYLNQVQINTGKIFDIGFRLDNGGNTTPDDLFLSDGPWGLNYDSRTSTISSFDIAKEEHDRSGGFALERTATIEASTSSYFSLYRAFTPRFKSVDLSQFNTLEFDAMGTGILEITIVKEGVDRWENQFKATIDLQSSLNHYYIPLNHFTSETGETIDLHDAVSLVFTMSSDEKKVVKKKISLGSLMFSFQETFEPHGLLASQKVILTPNPIQGEGKIYFSLQEAQSCKLNVYDMSGKILFTQNLKGLEGMNTLSFDASSFNKGLYLLQITGNKSLFVSQKFVVE